MLDNVEITSDGLAFDFVRGSKIAAKASSVTALGKPLVREIGRWSEKKAEAQISVYSQTHEQFVDILLHIRLGAMCCVLGTLGSA